MKKFLTILLLLVICSSCNNGKDSSLSGKALEFYKKAANGDSEAMNNLGDCYYNGEGGAYLNHEKAVYWYKEAAKKGNPGGQCNLGKCFENGKVVKQDFKKAAKLYRRAAEQGYAEAQYRLGHCYDDENDYDKAKNKYGLEHDPKQAFWWHKKAADNGYAEAQYKLGEIYSSSYESEKYGVSENTEYAKDWFRKAAEQGHEGAKKKLETQLAEETPSVPYKNTTQKTANKEYVDLGLPSGTLWATMNVGAKRPEDYGDFFAWGETSPKSTYDWSTYKWSDGSVDFNQTKYCTNSDYGTVDNKTELEPNDDAATVNWGMEWRMPSSTQMNELCSECTWQWSSLNGVEGCVVTGKNGSSLFLPAAGYHEDSSFAYFGEEGSYWSRTLGRTSSEPESLMFSTVCKFVYYLSSDSKCQGQSVRPVRAKQGHKDTKKKLETQLQLPSCHRFTLTGTIGSNSNIHGSVIINDNQILGNYGYKSKPYGCTVKGHTYENGSMRATEIEDKTGKTTGEYRGNVVSNNKIEGTFYSEKYCKNLPFTWFLH